MKTYLLPWLVFSLLISSCAKTQDKHLNYLALGDSYTIGESVYGVQRWPIQLATTLSDSNRYFETTAVARTGWRTDDLMLGIRQSNLPKEFDLVSLLIGVNNQFQKKSFEQYDQEFPQLLATAIEYARGDTGKVFVVSIPDYYYTPFGQANGSFKISDELNAYNTFAEKTCHEWGIPFINITPISMNGLTNPELVAEDGLHPSAEQYRLWVELIQDELNFELE
ncbi:MAG: SGNH/GDSL hydrolase family protein [Flavobacteriales bacterium]|jgi:acyl-CoA thioesterase I|nr:SGNH/GDSL hydrolase family protein [Flavobacteriales bacterium]